MYKAGTYWKRGAELGSKTKQFNNFLKNGVHLKD